MKTLISFFLFFAFIFPGQAQITVRVMSYNIHRAVGLDGRLDCERIGRIIEQAQPDIVALQDCLLYTSDAADD